MKGWGRQAALVATVECRLQMTSVVWRVLLLLSVVLAATMTSASLQDYTRRQSEVDILVARRDQATDRGQHTISGFQRDEALRVVRDPAPLSAVVTGLDKRIAQYWDFGPEGTTAGSAISGEPTALVARADLDLESILRGLIGILALVAGFSSMVVSSGGTTKPLVSLTVYPAALIVGSIAGGTIAVALASALVVATSAGTLLFGSRDIVSSVSLWSLAALWLASALYGGVLVGSGALVALVASTMARAVAAIAVIWLVTTTIAGPVIGAVADWTTPGKSRGLFEITRNAEYEQTVVTIEDDAGAMVLQHWGVTELPRGFEMSGALLKMVEQHWTLSLKSLRARLDALEFGFAESRRDRTRNAWWLSAIFPGTAFGYAATELAGVGEAHARRWTEDANTHQRALGAAVFDNRPRLYARVQSGSGYRVVFHDRAAEPMVMNLPTFHPSAATPLMRLRDAGPSLAVLVLQAATVWLFVIGVFRRRLTSPNGWR